MSATHPNSIRAREYSAGLVSQSFWFVEFRNYLKLRFQGKTQQELREQIVEGNLFGAPNPYRAKRIYGYLTNRAAQLDDAGLRLFFASDLSTQKLLNLICVLRQDRLFFEFVYEVYREKALLGAEILEPADGSIFFKNKERQSDVVAAWTGQTQRRVLSCYLNFLTDANLLADAAGQKKITPPLLDSALERYLETNGEDAMIKALTGVF